MKVEVDVISSPSLVVLMASVDVERATFEEESEDMHNPPIKLTRQFRPIHPQRSAGLKNPAGDCTLRCVLTPLNVNYTRVV